MAGEKQDGREHIDRTTKHLIEKGGLPPELAQRRAREARIRNEQRENGERR
jgi:heme exporter protein D